MAVRNKHPNGRFVRQVRIVKGSKHSFPNSTILCSLAAESLTYVAALLQMSHARAVAVTLRYAAQRVLGSVLDPTGVDDLSVKWSGTQRQTYSTVLARGADRAEEALRLEGDAFFSAASNIWASLLGEDFPEPALQTEEEAIEGLVAGSITSTGRTTTSRHGVERSRPTRHGAPDRSLC